MKLPRSIIISLCVIGFLMTSQDIFSAETNSCHCFKNRVYDPADRFGSDEYLLATSFNSLMSKMYNIPKRQIVFLKMKGGATHLDLIIALRASQICGYELQQLLNLRKQKKAWKEILSMPEISAKASKDILLIELLKGKDVEIVGPRIANTLITEFYSVPPQAVQQLRQSGLNEKEMSLVFILSHKKGIQPTAIAKQHQAGKSWSQAVHDLNISLFQVAGLIMGYGNTPIN